MGHDVHRWEKAATGPANMQPPESGPRSSWASDVNSSRLPNSVPAVGRTPSPCTRTTSSTPFRVAPRGTVCARPAARRPHRLIAAHLPLPCCHFGCRPWVRKTCRAHRSAYPSPSSSLLTDVASLFFPRTYSHVCPQLLSFISLIIHLPHPYALNVSIAAIARQTFLSSFIS